MSEPQPPVTAGPGSGSARRAALPLLSRITEDALDEDYLLAARRRALVATPAPPGPAEPAAAMTRSRRPPWPPWAPWAPRAPWAPWAMRAGVLAAFGLLVAIAGVQTSRQAAVDETSRATLIDRITQRRSDLSLLQERLAGLRTGNAAQDRRLGDLEQQLDSVDRELRRVQVRTGFVAVTGPGVRAVVENAPDADPVDRIRDEDLALLVNGLWSAGAEAVAVNGQRLTAISAIRNSGAAVEVNDVGVAPPFTVVAIGDPRSLQADFFDTASGLAFEALRQSLGFGFEMHNEGTLSLPAAPDRLLLRLHDATALESSTGAPGDGATGDRAPSGSGAGGAPRPPGTPSPGSPETEEGAEP